MLAEQTSSKSSKVSRRKIGRVARMRVGGKRAVLQALSKVSVGVWSRLRGRAVGLDQPYLPISKVIEQFLVVAPPHVARPYHLGSINIRFVVYPLPVKIVMRSVTHDDKLRFWKLLQLAQDHGSFQIPARPCGFDQDVSSRRCQAQQNHSARHH